MAVNVGMRTVTRGRRRPVLRAAVSALPLGAVSLVASVAQAAPISVRPAPTLPASTQGEFLAVAAVPHSLDVWAIGGNGGTPDHARFFVAHRHDGRWTRVKTPDLGGRFGNLDAITAVSARGVWIGGERQQSRSSRRTFPAIWRLSGHRFVAQKLPKQQACGCGVLAMSGSSASNVWAVGAIFGVGGSTLHWNGKKWSAVPIPAGGDTDGLTAVSTSGPDNAWAATDSGEFLSWRGKSWTVDGMAATGDDVTGIATTSPTLAYAVGATVNLSTGARRTLLMRFNGKAWSNAPLAKGIRAELSSVTMHGTSAWAVGVTPTAANAFPVIVHSTGGTWTRQPPPSGGGRFTLNSVSAESARHVYVVGIHRQDSVSGLRTFFEVYDGHSWKPAASKF